MKVIHCTKSEEMLRNWYVYLSRWTPFGDVSLDMGCLAVVEASHAAPEFKHLQVGKMILKKMEIALGRQSVLLVKYSSLPLRCVPHIFSLKELSFLPALSGCLCMHFYIRPKVENS